MHFPIIYNFQNFRLGSYVEADALVESGKGGHPAFFREKPTTLSVTEGEPAHLSCFAVGDPKPIVQWFKNDAVIQESKRITFASDLDGRAILQVSRVFLRRTCAEIINAFFQFTPASMSDTGIYKVVARNRINQTVARVRVLIATRPDPVSIFIFTPVM